MKKQSIYALIGAIALSGSIGFSSCSSDDKVAESPNPGYNPDTGEVPVEFLFNVGSSMNRSSTRQSADATQADNNLKATKFRGIGDAHILCFAQTEDGKFVSSPIVATKDFDMATVAFPGSLGFNAAGDNSTTTRVLEMTFPLGTNSMVFYGRALTEESGNYKNIYGHLDEYNGGLNLADVSFALGRRLSSNDKAQFTEIESLIAAILSCIMQVNRGTASVSATDVPEPNVDPYNVAISSTDAQGLNWEDYYEKLIAGTPPNYTDALSPVETTKSLSELEIKLAKAYKELTTIHVESGELRNGSGPALNATIKELWGVVNSVRCAEPTSLRESVAKYMAQLIHTELDKYFNPVFEGTARTEGGSPSSVSLKDRSTVLVPRIKDDDYWPGDDFADDAFSYITLNDLNTFPATFNIPQGSTHLQFNRTSHQFSYVQDYNNSAVGGTLHPGDEGYVPFTADDYYYPAELLYFGNSPIRVSNDPHEVLQYPQSTDKWNTENSETPVSTDSWYGWTANGKIESSTRSVAMTNDINYGTALLEMTIGYSSNTLYDNNHAVQQRDYSADEPNHEITPTDQSFKLVGVLVGGQSPRVGWNFLPALKAATETTPAERQGYIYDNQIAITVIPATGNSASNYTMVFDNYNSSLADGAQETVYIALEFQNNSGMDFFGKDNLIPNGSNFYLIGKLDPNQMTTGETPTPVYTAPDLPAYHALPPYGLEGTKTVKRVFIQDHRTVVNFKIGETSLQKAYLTVPDLRSSSVTLGLSVDMSWSTGLTFDNIVLGN